MNSGQNNMFNRDSIRTHKISNVKKLSQNIVTRKRQLGFAQENNQYKTPSKNRGRRSS